MTVTLDTSQVKNWQYGGAGGKVRFFLNKTITMEDDAQYQKGDVPRLGSVSINGFFTETTHTVAGSIVTVATAVLPVTESAIDNPDATITAAILDEDDRVKAFLFQNFRIPETLGPVIQLEDLVLHNQHGLPLRDTSVYNKTEVNLLVSNQLAGTGAPKATTLAAGIGRISGVPLDVNDPIFLGTNDLEWLRQDKQTVNVREYASLAAAITAIGATDATLLIPSSVTVSANLTIPANVTLWFAGSGAINISGASTVVTINGALEAPLRQIFTGVLTSSNIICGSKIGVIRPEWWGNTPTAIQSAANAMPLTGGVIELSSPYSAQAAPVWFRGETFAFRGNKNTAHGFGAPAMSGSVLGPMVFIGNPDPLTYGTSLATGAGQALTVAGNVTPLILSSYGTTTDLNGLAAFTAECFVKPTSGFTPGAGAYYILSSRGAEPPLGGVVNEAFSLSVKALGDANDGKVQAKLTVGGVLYTLDGTTVLTVGNTYHLALSYDGATIRLFVNGVMEDSEAATGTITQRVAEDVTVAACYVLWPQAYGVIFSGVVGSYDSIRLSRVARYTAPFTNPTTKRTSDSDTLVLLNFDNISGPFVIAESRLGSVYLPVNSAIAEFLDGVVVEDLAINNATGVALMTHNTPHCRVENVSLSGTIGLKAHSQHFICRYVDVRITTLVGVSRIGAMLLGNGSAATWERGDIEGCPYGLVQSTGMCLIDGLFINTYTDTVVPLYILGFVLSINDLWLDDETAPIGATRQAGAVFFQMERIVINGGHWWMSQTAVPLFKFVSCKGGEISNAQTLVSAAATSVIEFTGAAPDVPFKINNVLRTAPGNAVPFTTSALGGYVEINHDKVITQTAKTALYTLTDVDHCVVGDTTAGGFTFTLPAVAGRQGKEYVIANVGSANTLTVAGNAAELIGSANTYTKLVGASVFKIKCNGVKWIIIQEWFNPAAPGAIGATTPAAGAFTTVSATGQVTSTLATGTAPLVIASTTKVSNLNVDQLDGADWAAPAAIGSGTPAAGSFTTVSATGAITSTVATGNPPLVVASTTNVPNLNASSLSGATFAAPGAIGGGTPGTGAFTALSASTSATVGGGTAITKIVKGTVTINPASVAGTTVATQTFALVGAAAGDILVLNIPVAGLTAGLLVNQYWVSATDEIKITFFNQTGAPIDEASASWTYALIRS